MPTVPVVDQTASAPTQFAAPGVTPVRDSSAGQLGALGDVLQQTGSAATRIGQTIGARVQDQVDDAKTKAAVTAFQGAAQAALYNPQNGYLNQLGKSAVDNFAPTQQTIVKSKEDALATLDNPIQKQMFDQVATQHMLDISKTMAVHNHSQTVAWAAGESKARADGLNLQALQTMGSRYQVDETGAPIGDFAKYTAQMDAEVTNAMALAGHDPDSAQTKSAIREQRTALNHSMISQLLDNHDAYGAKKWFDEQMAAGNIDIRNASSLGNAVRGEYDRQRTSDLADMAISASLTPEKKPATTLAMPVPGSSINVTAGLGEARSNGRSHDGIDIAVPVGTNVMAPAAGKVLKVWTDTQFGGGLSVQMQMPNGYIAGFAHLSAANVHVGDEIQQGAQLGLSGKSGNATGPVLHYMMKDADGKYVDPRQVSQPQPNRAGFSDPTAFESARSFIMNSDAPPEIKRAALSQVQTQHAQYREVENQQQAEIFKQASNAFYAGGMNAQAIRPSLFAQLTPEQQQKFKDEQTSKVMKDYSQSQFFKERGEIDIVSQFIQNPDQLTPANVDKARARLSDSTYLSFMRQAEAQAKNPQGVQEAQGIQDQVKYLASHAGINVEPKSQEDKQKWIDLNARIQQSLNQARASNNGKVTQEQAQKVIQHELIQRTITAPRSQWTAWIPGLSPTVKDQLPLGAVNTGEGSDGKTYYLDRNGIPVGEKN